MSHLISEGIRQKSKIYLLRHIIVQKTVGKVPSRLAQSMKLATFHNRGERNTG